MLKYLHLHCPMDLSTQLNDNYAELKMISKRITGRRSRQALELINTTYLDLYDKQKAVPKDREGFVKWFSKCLYINFNMSRSVYNRTKTREILINAHPDVLDGYYDDLEIPLEDTNEATKEFIEISSTMKKERAFKYIQVLEFKKSLSLLEQEVFDLYFVNNLSGNSISEKLIENGVKMYPRDINRTINGIKAKIKQTKWQ